MSFYARLADRQQSPDTPDLHAKIVETIQHLTGNGSDKTIIGPNRHTGAGMLLGRIQSGKTRAFIGIIAACFDAGFDGAIVLTKGTKSLAYQTFRRLELAFNDLRDMDLVQIFDVMQMPERLSAFELAQKLIIVAKKEDDNLRRLLGLFGEKYPTISRKRWLIIDDEADFASIAFRKVDGSIAPGIINEQVDKLRKLLNDTHLLEVTATPYSLYLQPEEGMVVNNIPILKPRKPSFTVVLPTHPAYVGGEYYFEESANEDSPAAFLYKEVPMDERDALKKQDGRRFRVDDVLTTPKIAVLRQAVMNFAVGGCIRRLQQEHYGSQQQKYAFVIHTEQGRNAHEWQLEVVDTLWRKLMDDAEGPKRYLDSLIADAYAELLPSVRLAGGHIPAVEDVRLRVVQAIRDGWLMAEKVNSDREIEALLDPSGQLRLRTPLNLFVGGQILDRGITIQNLIGFYYGRNPQRAQQDTTLQHARMYGARDPLDMGVTRFYAPLVVYNRMRQIHELDASLRDAFLSGGHENGIYFVQTDDKGRITPCAPNNLLISQVYTMRPGKRSLPIGFNTVAAARGHGRLSKLDDLVHKHMPKPGAPALVPVRDAVEMIRLAFRNLEFEDPDDADGSEMALIAALEWLSKTSPDTKKGNVWLITAEDRDLNRMREEGRFNNSPDTKQQKDAALQQAKTLPVLMMLRQNGRETDGWRGLPFWWPVVMAPTSAVTSLYSVN